MRFYLHSTNAFLQPKKALASAAMLVHPDPKAHIALIANASDVAVGAVLVQQHTVTGWQPLAIYSCKLPPPELNYSAFD